MFQKNCIDNISSKSQKRQRLITFILLNTIQYPRTLKNSIYHSSKRVPPPFFHSDTNPVFCHILIHSFDKIHVLVVTVELIWLLLLNILSLRFRRSYVKRPAVVLISNISYTAFLLDMRCVVQIGYVPIFCSCFSPMIVYLCNLFLFLLLECC